MNKIRNVLDGIFVQNLVKTKHVSVFTKYTIALYNIRAKTDCSKPIKTKIIHLTYVGTLRSHLTNISHLDIHIYCISSVDQAKFVCRKSQFVYLKIATLKIDDVKKCYVCIYYTLHILYILLCITYIYTFLLIVTYKVNVELFQQ